VQKIVDTYLLKFTVITGGAGLTAIIFMAFFAMQKVPVFLMAYVISFVFVGSNFLAIRKINLDDQNRFFKIFGWTLAIRFVMVIAVLVVILKMINNHQIFFTVSFIISYICHSVIEIIFLNKILETDTKK
jgi:hypothetical protein